MSRAHTPGALAHVLWNDKGAVIKQAHWHGCVSLMLPKWCSICVSTGSIINIHVRHNNSNQMRLQLAANRPHAVERWRLINKLLVNT